MKAINYNKLSKSTIRSLDLSYTLCQPISYAYIDLNIFTISILNDKYIFKYIVNKYGNHKYLALLNALYNNIYKGGEAKVNHNTFDEPVRISKDVIHLITNNEIGIKGETIFPKDLLMDIINTEGSVLLNAITELEIDFDQLVTDSETKSKSDISNELKTKIDKDPLAKYCMNMNEIAKEGGYDSVVNRDVEIQRIEDILLRRRKNNPVLVGDAGVGKTAIIEGIVNKIVNGKSGKFLKNKTVYSITASSLLDGTRFRGDLEEKINTIVDELSKDPNKIIFIDEIHNIMKNSSEIADLLKPILASGKINCIGATTFSEWRKYFSKDASMERRFSIVNINEPSINETISILNTSKVTFEKYHGVTIGNKETSYIVSLCDKYMLGKNFPDKAFDILDEACVKAKGMGNNCISVMDIELAIYNVTGKKVISDKFYLNQLKNIEPYLNDKVKGQEGIIHSVSRLIQISEAGLNTKKKTKGVFLFNGTSGVGKTMLANTVGDFLQKKIIKIDMGNYSESHSISKLIGSPPGYHGHDEGGQLTEFVSQNPHCVVILDEIDKAHRKVLNAFLGIFEVGEVMDAKGRVIDFSNCFVFMTSNDGLAGNKKKNLGFVKGEVKDSVFSENKFLAKEFVNRIDIISNFQELKLPSIKSITKDHLKSLKLIMKEKNVNIQFKESCILAISKEAVDFDMGARSVSRIIDNKIKPILIEIIQDIDHEETIKISYDRKLKKYSTL